MQKILKITTIMIIMALVFCTCAFCLVGCNSNRGNIDISDDIDDDYQSGFQLDIEDTPEVGLTMQEIDPSEYEDYGVSMAAESAFTLTATVTPKETSHTEVEWSYLTQGIFWSNDKELTDYVIFDVEDNTCIISCLQPFGSKITVRCSSTYNKSLFADCSLDYVSRVESVKFTCDPKHYGHDSDYNDSYVYYADLDFGGTATIGVEIEYGVGTLMGDIEFGSITTSLAPNCFDALKTAVTDTNFNVVQDSTSFIQIDFNQISGTYSKSASITLGDISCFYTSSYVDPTLCTGYAQFTKAFYDYTIKGSRSYHAKMVCSYTYSYSSLGTLCEGSFEMPINIAASSIDVVPSAVSFKQSSFVF